MNGDIASKRKLKLMQKELKKADVGFYCQLLTSKVTWRRAL